MPILAPEPTFFPDSLFDPDGVDEGGRRWAVLHTRARQEKSLARQLNEQRIPFFLPLLRKRLVIRGKAVYSGLPLFAGYVFLLGEPDDDLFARATRRVARVIDVPDQQRLWHDLRQINRLIVSGVPIRREDDLVPGALVEIHSGPLTGLRGVILRSANGNRFIVKVDFIQRGASVLLDEGVLTRVLE